jgi:hypothetical protein
MADVTYNPNRPVDRRDEEPTFLGAVLQRTSWGAVIAGAVVAIGLQMLLTVLGIAIGATTADASDYYSRAASSQAMAPAIWWLVTGTISLLIGGCVVGRFAGMTRSPDVLLHGLTMWGVTALFGFLVVTSGAGMLYGTTMNSSYMAHHAGDRYGLPAGVTGANVTAQEVDRTALRADTNTPAERTTMTAEEARRATRNASWWTLFGLALGIAATLMGSWFTAPNRIVVRPASQG